MFSEYNAHNIAKLAQMSHSRKVMFSLFILHKPNQPFKAYLHLTFMETFFFFSTLLWAIPLLNLEKGV